MAEELRKRARGKLIRVTFPSGKVICYKNVTDTFIGVLCEIGSDRFPEIKLELCHLPILSQEIYPRYKDWMKPVCDGWYLNAQSNTDQKYMQLRSMSDSLGLNLTVEIGANFEPQENPNKVRGTKSKDKLLVKLPDGEYLANQNTTETFSQAIWEIGIDDIMRRNLEYGGTPLISLYQMSNRQIQIGENRWLTVPNTTKDKAKMLKVIALHLHLKLEVTII